MYEKEIKEIKDMEEKIGIKTWYKWWNNEMYDFIYSKGYNTFEIYDEIMGDNLKSPSYFAPNMEDVMKWMVNYKGGQVGLFNVDKTYVYMGTGGDCDTEFCKKNNIYVVDFKQSTWTFVIFDGCLSISYDDSLRKPIENQHIFEKMRRFLGAWLTWNDYLINGYKVAGCSHTMGKWIMSLSFTVDVDLIRKICKKPMEKVPKGITELTGITREDFVNWLKTWWIE